VALDCRNKPVPPASQRFNIARLVGGVPQHLAKPIHRRVQSMLEIDERAASPKLLLKLIPADNLTGAPDERNQDLQRLSLKPQTNSVLMQFARSFVERKRAEEELPRRTGRGLAAH